MRLFGCSALRYTDFDSIRSYFLSKAISSRSLNARMAISISIHLELNSASNASSNQAVGILALVQSLSIAGTVPLHSPRRHFVQLDALHVKPLPIFALWKQRQLSFLQDKAPWDSPFRPVRNRSCPHSSHPHRHNMFLRRGLWAPDYHRHPFWFLAWPHLLLLSGPAPVCPCLVCACACWH